MKSSSILSQPIDIIENDSSMKTLSSYEQISAFYERHQCWGLLTSIDVKNCISERIRSAETIKAFVIELCDLIKMKRFQDTMVVNFGEDEKVAGYSMVQLIETSLISGHFANLTNSAYIDIFSCKLYDPNQAAEFTKNYFGASDVVIHTCFRK